MAAAAAAARAAAAATATARPRRGRVRPALAPAKKILARRTPRKRKIDKNVDLLGSYGKTDVKIKFYMKNYDIDIFSDL